MKNKQPGRSDRESGLQRESKDANDARLLTRRQVIATAAAGFVGLSGSTALGKTGNSQTEPGQTTPGNQEPVAEEKALAAPDTNTSGDQSPIKYCLNMSTVRGHELAVDQQIDLAANAGYDAVELWIPEIRKFAETGSLADLGKRIADSGMTLESAIGFANWIVDDETKRQSALQEAARDMDMLAVLGGKRIAAPPVGAHQEAGPELAQIAERYRALLELGAEKNVTPQLELWGFSKTLSRLGELAYVATECGHPDACVLPDVYHIYKGGSDFAGLAMIEASRIKVFHMNDYPADPPRSEIGDADRVYPGDGIAPLNQIINTLLDGGFNGFFSLELFNRTYWSQPAEQVAATGLQKMKDSVVAAMSWRNNG